MRNILLRAYKLPIRGMNRLEQVGRRAFSSTGRWCLKTRGTGVFGALGNGELDDHVNFTKIDMKDLVPSKVAAGWGHSTVVTECGKLLVFGRPFDFNTLMRINGIYQFFGKRSVQAIQMLTRGFAQGPESGVYLQPVIMDGVSDVQDVHASAGLTAVRTRAGEVYTFGRNHWGQCGTGNMEAHVFSPVKVKGLPRISAMDCGLQHCVAVAEDGAVFSWGKGNRGQLGDELGEHSASPVRVPLKGRVTAVSAGFAHTAALMEEDGSVWVWGKGMSSKLKSSNKKGEKYMPEVAVISQFEDQMKPRRVALPGGRRVVQMASSIYSMAVLADDHTLWMLGMGEYDRNRVAEFVQVHDILTEEELDEPIPADGVVPPFRPAIIPEGSFILKGHDRITVAMPGDRLLQALLHEKEAILQPMDVKNGQEGVILGVAGVRDVAVGWKHTLAVVREED